MKHPRPIRPSAYDPNLLFDELLRRLGLEGDEALSQRLNIGPGILQRIRRGDNALGAPMLIRISEHCGIAVSELRRMAGDRRAEVRLDDPARNANGPEQRTRPRRAPSGLIRDEPGLPANVQWT